MGLIGKLKNIFYDEEIVEVKDEPIVREEKKEEIRKPRIEEIQVQKEEKIENTYSERELFKSEPTFKFPVIDEDDDEPVQTRSRVNTIDLDRRESAKRPERVVDRVNEIHKPNVNVTIGKEKNSEKTFTPSPVISPIYGILDKNYTKEEIKEKVETSKRPSESEFNYDYVRRKAYGTLEDELENTLTKLNNEVDKKVKEESKDDSKSIEELLNEIEENANISVGDLEERIKDEFELEEEKQPSILDEKEEIKVDNELSLDADDKTLEHDLFNLIDSMYEDKEGE
mgnify:CR=1 FL=1